ncbi:hypothetical protein PoB_000824200 [Plakobranchus ocellatus]|uniref:Uncharacterized protein n=1 Tax=Plakobranchus ocellatus TaxID=259542 RepID=A0AAV3YFW5_9GAST|nr:hypothetical protein PoB_000824200 [Plakobranchus ocellatus]
MKMGREEEEMEEQQGRKRRKSASSGARARTWPLNPWDWFTQEERRRGKVGLLARSGGLELTRHVLMLQCVWVQT